jgi:hypothetical protein
VRGGGKRKVKLPVQDLHAITPADYLEIGDGVLTRCPGRWRGT